MAAPLPAPLVGQAYRKVLLTCVAVLSGLAALWLTQTILQADGVQTMVKACEAAPWTRADRHEFLRTYRDFEPLLGGSFACLSTQFLDGLVEEDPAGMITWVSCLCLCLPAIVAMVVEAGRGGGAVGPVRYPSAVLLVGQYVGLSVVVPLVWVPSYIWGRATFRGAVSESRAAWASVGAFFAFLWTYGVFSFSRESYAWIVSAGCFAGPALALLPLACWAMEAPPEEKASPYATRSVVLSYKFAGALSFLMWAAVVAKSFGHYRLDVPTLVGDLWVNAHGFVRFMTVDTVCLYLGMLAYVEYAEIGAVRKTLWRTLVLGPGAALAVTLAELEPERSSLGANTKQEGSGDILKPRPKQA
jgi:hypothetical protein